MKSVLVAVVGVSVAVLTAFAETPKQETELTGAGIFYKPGQDEDYDSGFGAEAQARFWLNLMSDWHFHSVPHRGKSMNKS